ncbi:hypothetical protein Tco_0151155, partial [Tanacetum coccineum]
MVPRAVLMKSGLVLINTAKQNISKTTVLVNTARQVNAAHSKTTVNAARPMSYLSKTTHSTVKRPINNNTAFKNSNINQRVNTLRGKNVNTARPKVVVNVVQGNNVNAVKASAWNMSYLTDYKEIDRGYVAFGENPKGEKITEKGSGRDWLFDIDALTRTMNYEPIVAEPVKDYILLPLWTADPPFSQDPKSSHDDGSKPSSDDGKKVDEDPRKENEC